MTVFKYPLHGVDDYHEIDLPAGAIILSVQAQNGIPTLWALADPERPKTMRRFRFAGTGHPITETPDQLQFIETMRDGSLVWHIFEVIS